MLLQRLLEDAATTLTFVLAGQSRSPTAFGDSVVSEWTGKVPDGHNTSAIGEQIATIARLGGEIGSCATCLDARGITENMIAKDAYRSSMNELTQWALVGGQGDQHLTTGPVGIP